jgi:hypothetical protein
VKREFSENSATCPGRVHERVFCGQDAGICFLNDTFLGVQRGEDAEVHSPKRYQLFQLSRRVNRWEHGGETVEESISGSPNG